MRAPNGTTFPYFVIPAALLGIAVLLGPVDQAMAQDAAPAGATRSVEGISGSSAHVLDVPANVPPKATPRRHLAWRGHHHSRHLARVERPALAGVVLVEPVPGPFKAPQRPVIAPAYLFDSFAADLTTPPPSLVCEHRPRDPGLPDPHLYREVPVACHYDID